MPLDLKMVPGIAGGAPESSGRCHGGAGKKGIFFLILHFFHISFANIYGPKFFCKTIHLAPWETAEGTYRRAPWR
jgi:hypothetical protein